MPTKHLKGVSEKEQRQYEHIKESAEKSCRYGGRAPEVAARTVMKHHQEEKVKKAASSSSPTKASRRRKAQNRK